MRRTLEDPLARPLPLLGRPELRGLGLRKNNPKDTPWMDAETFYTALEQDPEGVQALLSEPDGLLTV